MAADLTTTVNRWKGSTATGEQRYKDGINATQVDPTQLAIANQTQLLQNFSQAVTSGRWAARLAAAGKAKWQTNSVNKSPNWSVGVQQGGDSYQSAMSVWLPIIDGAAATVRSMPSGTLAASQARSAEFMRILYNRKRGI